MSKTSPYANTRILRRIFNVLRDHEEGLLITHIKNKIGGEYNRVGDGLTFLISIKVVTKFKKTGHENTYYKLDESYYG